MKRLFPALAGAALLAACTPSAPPATAPAPVAAATAPRPTPPPAQTYAPMDLGGQKVLVLPVQRANGLQVGTDDATGEFAFALRERDTRTQWVMPDALRRALAGAPAYAPDPRSLPTAAFAHGQLTEPLAGIVRRYTALTDTRLVVIPSSATYLPAATGTGGQVRFDVAVVDSRSGAVLWRGTADGEPTAAGDRGAVAGAAAAVAARMLRGDTP